jgi:ubiquinone/menaquinone biosynthesis C-methylase UbiE
MKAMPIWLGHHACCQLFSISGKNMPMAQMLFSIISDDVSLRLVEPGIYSVYSAGETPGLYDTPGASTIYDVVACNRLYNRLMWGYSVGDYITLCEGVLASSSDGWVLDIACGSLAFTAKLYARYSRRPVVLLDQSLKLLRKGKARVVGRNGRMPDNMFFLHGDALHLPFKADIFDTVISLNLLHCLDDISAVLKELKRVLRANGAAALTTLVRSGRWSDGYLNALARGGAVVPRGVDDLLSAFDEMNMPVKQHVKGNLAFITYRCGAENEAPNRNPGSIDGPMGTSAPAR